MTDTNIDKILRTEKLIKILSAYKELTLKRHSLQNNYWENTMN